MKKIIERIKNNGIHSELSQELRQNIEICNLFNIIDILLIIPFIFLFRQSFTAAALTATPIFFHFLSFVLIHFRKYNLGRFIYSITTATAVYFVAALIYNDYGTDGLAAKFLILGTIIMPFIVFKKDEWKLTLAALSLNLFYIISFNSINSYLNIPGIKNFDSVELRLLSIVTTFIIICSIFFYYKKIIIEQQLKQEESNLILQKKNDALNQSNATKNKLFSIVAHDLRNPLHAILGLAEMFYNKNQMFNEQELREYSKLFYHTSKNTCTIAKNLLSWSQSQQNNITNKPIGIDILTFINEVVTNTKSSAENKNINITVNTPANLTVLADINIAKVVLRNLITNAIKFSHRNSIVSVNASIKLCYDKEFIEICVADSGIGMDKNHVAELLNNNTLNSKSGTDNEKGTGLGLLLCKDFVERNGGEIYIESEPGKGSKFYFTQPTIIPNLINHSEIQESVAQAV